MQFVSSVVHAVHRSTINMRQPGTDRNQEKRGRRLCQVSMRATKCRRGVVLSALLTTLNSELKNYKNGSEPIKEQFINHPEKKTCTSFVRKRETFATRLKKKTNRSPDCSSHGSENQWNVFQTVLKTNKTFSRSL